jgi:NAD(P)-dependent dehydrogenase (short-subunit alcohol dehydrogenase family)
MSSVVEGEMAQTNHVKSRYIGFTKSVVPELVRIIRCNAIAPGFIETDSN